MVFVDLDSVLEQPLVCRAAGELHRFRVGDVAFTKTHAHASAPRVFEAPFRRRIGDEVGRFDVETFSRGTDGEQVGASCRWRRSPGCSRPRLTVLLQGGGVERVDGRLDDFTALDQFSLNDPSIYTAAGPRTSICVSRQAGPDRAVAVPGVGDTCARDRDGAVNHK